MEEHPHNRCNIFRLIFYEEDNMYLFFRMFRFMFLYNMSVGVNEN